MKLGVRINPKNITDTENVEKINISITITLHGDSKCQEKKDAHAKHFCSRCNFRQLLIIYMPPSNCPAARNS